MTCRATVVCISWALSDHTDWLNFSTQIHKKNRSNIHACPCIKVDSNRLCPIVELTCNSSVDAVYVKTIWWWYKRKYSYMQQSVHASWGTLLDDRCGGTGSTGHAWSIHACVGYIDANRQESWWDEDAKTRRLSAPAVRRLFVCF
jgi:hypothetical protein